MGLLNEKELKNFEDKFTKRGKEECWNWEASLYSTGYGQVSLRRLKPNHRVSHIFRAHRISKVHYHDGDLYDTDVLACHKCDNPSCVNPNHIFWGTSQDNMNDMTKKGRHVSPNQKGENNGASKLKQKDVDHIRLLLSTKNNTQIAKIYGVNHSTISLIRLGKSWKK